MGADGITTELVWYGAFELCSSTDLIRLSLMKEPVYGLLRCRIGV